MNDKAIIPLSAVRAALAAAIIKRKTAGHEIHGKPHCRFAAFTAYDPLITSPGCRNANGVRHRLPQLNFGAMHTGDLDRLVQRVHLRTGLREVRRTWGLGLRALQAELAGGVMR
ncbi:hypothetical protein D8B23_12795 [Verminephrobacter aporrectodeae subsp. tuberculatae]|uniref:hypothetical protein n=1 Tax=Verminephrobacter aporrectodeae TaxID=1110389 RepID=UPI0022447C2D|nr:hypothetical protein [Verminephrobacter aporrectodeae]MCW8199277.1 hypothetical protein [Verminephrobacter aporrectodeae subsp. tuberculatae]MCW8207652.1 hypothetical protein [Verminephrobacter aporrectodeae subsp. tuberculatae]